MDDEGNWRAFGGFGLPVNGSELKIGPVFRGEVFRDDLEAEFPWTATLNNLGLGRFATMQEGQERIEWEICNRVRLMAPAYKVLRARRA